MSLQALTVASKLEWGEWLRGIVGALISGAAASISAGVGVTLSDPAHDVNLIKVMFITAGVAAVVSLAKFLQMHPIPDTIGPNPVPPGPQKS